MHFVRLDKYDEKGIEKMSAMATEIVREHFDPLIGKEQNDYMLTLFQTVDAIRKQLMEGYQYYFLENEEKTIGFLAFYPKLHGEEKILYISKFYLYKDQRGQGYSKEMLDFIVAKAKEAGISRLELNVNRGNSARYAYEHLGFVIAREEKNDIGHGFYMDDYVYSLMI